MEVPSLLVAKRSQKVIPVWRFLVRVQVEGPRTNRQRPGIQRKSQASLLQEIQASLRVCTILLRREILRVANIHMAQALPARRRPRHRLSCSPNPYEERVLAGPMHPCLTTPFISLQLIPTMRTTTTSTTTTRLEEPQPPLQHHLLFWSRVSRSSKYWCINMFFYNIWLRVPRSTSYRSTPTNCLVRPNA